MAASPNRWAANAIFLLNVPTSTPGRPTVSAVAAITSRTVPVLSTDSVKGMPKGPSGQDLARRIADAQRLVEQVNRGKALTQGDSQHIRDLMRDDFLAWSKQFDLLPTTYRAERDRWIVDVAALTPEQWAKHRLDWLEAERDWIVSHGG
jgi:hypothetical protein